MALQYNCFFNQNIIAFLYFPVQLYEKKFHSCQTLYLHTSDSNGIGTVTPGFDPHRTIPTVSFFLCWELRSRSTWVFDEIKLLPKTSKYLTPTQKVSLSDPQASFIIWQYIAYIIMTLDFDCSLNMHELIDQAGM